MSDRLPASDLDDILGLQLSVAWAGEAAGDPPRLGWTSDRVDAEGGSDLFARLGLQTAACASVAFVRTAAIRVDAAAVGRALELSEVDDWVRTRDADCYAPEKRKGDT